MILYIVSIVMIVIGFTMVVYSVDIEDLSGGQTYYNFKGYNKVMAIVGAMLFGGGLIFNIEDKWSSRSKLGVQENGNKML